MRRMLVHVQDRQPGWTVEVRTLDADGRLATIAGPYDMDATEVGGRRVPTSPVGHTPPESEPHAALCAGDVEAISALLKRIRIGATQPDDVATYGRWLFHCLLATAWPTIQQHPDVQRDRAVEIALRWSSSDGSLHRLVWEAMRDENGPLGAHPSGVIAITRLVPATVSPVEPIRRVPRVLFASSVPVADPTIRPGAMFMGLLRGFDASGRCRARAIEGVSGESLAKACADFEPDVVHLVAHGVLLDNGHGALMLQSESGSEQETDAMGLATALRRAVRLPVAVVLSACNTASAGESAEDPADAAPLAAQLVAAGVPMVSAMAGEITESACRLYTRRFADSLHKGQSIVLASAHGRRAALIATPAPSTSIDWALPTLFLAENVDPSQALVDPTQADKLVGQAYDLDLRREPVFIGREDILDAADKVVSPASEAGVVAALARDTTAQLGGTRLLREIGWRLLRDGHIPVLLGPYPSSSAPTTGRGLVQAILSKIVTVTEKLSLQPFVPTTLAFDLDRAAERRLREEVAEVKPSRARALIRTELNRYLTAGGELDLASTRDMLADDFGELLEAARSAGAPFGEHSRAVLLCDDVHGWILPDPTGRARSACDFLLRMLERTGIGRAGQPIPVIFTGSATAAGGLLAEWRGKGQPGIRVLDLGELAADAAVLGFQWVLLHPWTTRPDADRELYGSTYTFAPNSRENWEKTLKKVGRLPTSVDGRLYFAADLMVDKECVRNNDEQLFHDYAKDHPEYQL